MKTPRKVVNISLEAHLILDAYCQRHSVNMGAWLSKLVLDTLKSEQAPTSNPMSFTPSAYAEQVLASKYPTSRPSASVLKKNTEELTDEQKRELGLE